MTPTPRDTFLVFLGGGAGALTRALLLTIFPSAGVFPLAVLLVNWAGAFMLALLTAVLIAGSASGVIGVRAEILRLLIGTGFLGGFTTYSTFALAIAQLGLTGQWVAALVYALLSLVGGYWLAWVGWQLGDRWGARGGLTRAGAATSSVGK